MIRLRARALRKQRPDRNRHQRQGDDAPLQPHCAAGDEARTLERGVEHAGVVVSQRHEAEPNAAERVPRPMQPRRSGKPTAT